MVWVMCKLVSQASNEYHYIRLGQEKGARVWERTSGNFPLEADSGSWHWSMDRADDDELVPNLTLWGKDTRLLVFLLVRVPENFLQLVDCSRNLEGQAMRGTTYRMFGYTLYIPCG